MADMNKLWHYTRTYMQSGRTNPQPKDFVSDLRNVFHITAQEKQELIKRARAWPGGDPGVVNDTVIDITQA